MKAIRLAVRDFALPVPRVGSIEYNSGYGHALADGQELHALIQEKNRGLDPLYEAEVKIEHRLEHAGYEFHISGRMDGLFKTDPPRIEEIKTCFNTWELRKKLTNAPLEHPYCLQLLTYGYLYWLENEVVPELAFQLVSTRNSETDEVTIKFNLAQTQRWFNLRLDELVIEEKRRAKRTERRKKIALQFKFPFETPRPGQVELIQTIEDGMKTRTRMLIQAPTGLGKTAGVLFPVLKEALGRGQNTIYVTPKNSQHSVAEDAVARFQSTGAAVKSLTITAKSKICLKNEPLCNPEFCEYSRDYYQKVAENDLGQVLAKKKKLNARVFRDLGEEFEVCPFELQFEAARSAEVLICDYNYVFAPRSSLERIQGVTTNDDGLPNLVIDEAHNLPSRAMDYFSPMLSSVALEKMTQDIFSLPERFRDSARDLIASCIDVIRRCSPEETDNLGKSAPESLGEQISAEQKPGGVLEARPSPKRRDSRLEKDHKSQVIEPPASVFLEQDGKIRSYLSRYLEGNLDIRPGDVVLRLSLYWSGFTQALEFLSDPTHGEFFTTFQRHPGGGIIKITCCDASKLIEPSYENYQQTVGFSATLKPFAYYAKLSGLDLTQIQTSEFASPFPKANRKILIIPQISTRYSDRERNYAKIAEALRKITSLRRGNYFVFFPSFDFLERVFTLCELGLVRGEMTDFTLLRQERYMKAAQTDAVLDHLRQRNAPTIVFAVQGGVFSEGVDYPGEMIIGAFIIGPPLPNFDLEREKMRKYYEDHYGSGFDYAYTFPAMAKAVQAAGRVIRSETDRGLIVLMDGRFIQPSYTQSMPKEWFGHQATELVSNAILKEISEFWEGS
jgi:DNA excision repair protein ERCC-2